ncbi:MAG: formate dehydrogenase accessory sulfurtransferase FdhD [Clostridium sp.]
MEQKTSHLIKRFKIDDFEEFEDTVVVEMPINIQLNNSPYITLMATPDKIKELAVGFLFCEGVIKDIREIKSIICNNTTINILLNKKVSNFNFNDRIISSGCGKGSMHISMINAKDLERCKFQGSFCVNKLLDQMNNFNKSCELFLETGGVHSCALSSGDEILSICEDIGRHNAFDKVIGKCLLEEVDITNKVLLTTGRVSSDIVLKAAVSNLPVIISHSAPTKLALQIGNSLNITIAGFARGKRMNVYTSYDRIK